MTNFVDPIFNFRKAFETEARADDILSTLMVVEINPTEMCNRTCVFCPRADPKIYKNHKKFMSPQTANNIAIGLRDIDFGYRGQISISGFGEPLLNQDLDQIIGAFRTYLPGVYIELICNGDFLEPAVIRRLLSAGVNKILVNLYDGPEQIDEFESRFCGVPQQRYMFRHHYFGPEQSYGLTLNNRTGLASFRAPLEEAAKRACHVPFYKMMIDWNGSQLLCFNDWGRRAEVSGNVNDRSVRDLWLSPDMVRYRRSLLDEDRTLTPCSTCDVIGTLHGASAFYAFREYYL
ncbi:radical SAM/SPASM domain-containing protein [Mesorhizobium sp.]|uniref:radical SAM/SPASM domain-containing protein n=1 Tax=Mesorhizobium sp. TaxID=1871066 RepID=UPI0025E70B43|nr:radical SAM/SPASM domain-containing protein [Mesorhizobium sp.]